MTEKIYVQSGWNDISSKDVRSPNAARIILEDVFNAVVNPHPYLKNTPEIFGAGGELLGNPRRKKTTIKQLFTAASKFQKHLRRFVYIRCIIMYVKLSTRVSYTRYLYDVELIRD